MIAPERPIAIDFRRLTRTDFLIIASWLSRPHVSRWWNQDCSPESVEREFGPGVDGTGPGEDYLVLDGPEPVGLVQYCRLADFPAYVEELSAVCPVPDGAPSIDYLIGDATRTEHGLGTRMIEAFTARIWELDPGASRGPS